PHEGRFGHIADREREILTERPGVLERGDGVRRLAGLRYRDDERVRIGYGIAVTVLRRDLYRARNAGDRLQPVAGGQAGMVTGAAGENRDRGDALENLLRIHAEELRNERLRTRRHFQRRGNGSRLLENLLLHEVPVRSQLDGVGGELALMYGTDRRIAARVEDAAAVAPDFDHVALFEVDDAFGHLQQRRRVARAEVLFLAQTEQQRSALSRHHQ